MSGTIRRTRNITIRTTGTKKFRFASLPRPKSIKNIVKTHNGLQKRRLGTRKKEKSLKYSHPSSLPGSSYICFYFYATRFFAVTSVISRFTLRCIASLITISSQCVLTLASTRAGQHHNNTSER